MVTVEQLKTGERPNITEAEFAALRGCSRSTLQKERLTGRGPAFIKIKENGRIRYEAQTILDYLSNMGQVCLSTSEYDTSTAQQNILKALSQKAAAKRQRNE